jgi:LexA-binding, inner membrane-associated putative hydrolase
MANFNTHLSVALGASAGAALLTVNLNIITITDAPWMIAFGAIGGMLPDIDSGNSTPIKLFFTTLALLALLAVINLFKNNYPPHWLLLMAAASYLAVRYGALKLFNHLTSHRGIFHSVLTAVFFCLLMVCIGCYLLHWDRLHSWLSGLFIGFGFIVHLLLDEVYSVDLSNRRMKKSFGTALKLYSYKNLTTSGLMAACTLGLVWITPQPQPLISAWQKQNAPQVAPAKAVKKPAQR